MTKPNTAAAKATVPPIRRAVITKIVNRVDPRDWPKTKHDQRQPQGDAGATDDARHRDRGAPGTELHIRLQFFGLIFLRFFVHFVSSIFIPTLSGL